MDKFTKGILTVIAVGIIGLNVQMMNGGGFIKQMRMNLINILAIV